MVIRLFSALVGAGDGFAIAAVPANADEDIQEKAQMCGTCHGQNGVPTDPKTIPIIWGQQQSYLVKQLHDYRSGDRDNPIMSPIAKGLAQHDLRKIAAYFAAKSWPAQHPAAASASPPISPPRLAGLSYEYLVAAMRGFATDERANTGDMPKFMQALTDSERDAMARYLSAL